MTIFIEADLPLIAEEICVLPKRPNKAIFKIKRSEVNNDILTIISELESRYPELYEHLDETPLLKKVGLWENNEVTIEELESFYDTVNKLLCNHFNTHDIIYNGIRFV